MPIIRQKTGGNRPGGGRPAIPRECNQCGQPACCAIAVLARSCGARRVKTAQRMKLGGSIYLCHRCACDLEAYAGDLAAASAEAIIHASRTSQQPLGPGLFHDLSGDLVQHQAEA